MLFVERVLSLQIGIRIFEILTAQDLFFLFVCKFVEEFEAVVHLTQNTSMETRTHVASPYCVLVVRGCIKVALCVTK